MFVGWTKMDFIRGCGWSAAWRMSLQTPECLDLQVPKYQNAKISLAGFCRQSREDQSWFEGAALDASETSEALETVWSAVAAGCLRKEMGDSVHT